MKNLFVSAVIAMAMTSWADTVYVDDDFYGLPGLDGSAERPYGTIQDAIDAVPTNSLILVRPGVYSQGGRSNGFGLNRVLIDKEGLTIRATGTKDETHIVGLHDSGSETGIGPNAVRCVGVDAGEGKVYRNSSVIGFTIRDGATFADSGTEQAQVSGGGFFAVAQNQKVYLIDCVVSNCVARNGGASYGGVLIRTLVTANRCTNMGAACRLSGLWNCLVVGNDRGAVTLESCYGVNCTLAANDDSTLAFYDGGLYHNCLSVGGKKNGGANVPDLNGSVIAEPNDCEPCDDATIDASPYQVMGPAFGDFRVVKGSVAETQGRVAFMAVTAISVPENEKYFDFNKNAIPTNAESICAGCLQEVAEPVGGKVVFKQKGINSIFGIPCHSDGLWAYPETYPTQFNYRADAVTMPVVAYDIEGGASLAAGNYRSPLMDDSFCVMPPPEVTGCVTVRTVTASVVYYVNPDENVGSDAHAGDAEHPFRTIHAAYSAVPTGVNAVIFAAEGTYGADQGVTTAAGSRYRAAHTVSSSTVRLKGAGIGKSVIVGARDDDFESPDPALPKGCGAHAVAGIYLKGVGIIQGFTFKDCAASTSTTSTGGDGYPMSDGAPFYMSATALVADCLVTNCVAKRGCCGYGNAAYERCRFFDCRSDNGGFRAARWWSSCLFGECFSNYGVFYKDSVTIGLYNCTAIRSVADKDYANSGVGLFNTIMTRDRNVRSASSYAGNVFWDFDAYVVREGYQKMDPEFVSASGDWRLFADSKAIAAGAGASEIGDWYKYATADVNGQPLAFVNGKAIPGCFQRTASAVRIDQPSAGSLSPDGRTAFEPGESVTVTFENSDPPRPFVGMRVDGELVIPRSASVAVRNDLLAGEQGRIYRVEAILGTNWYVNAAAPDDTGDGMTAETAKKFLSSVFGKCQPISGDSVIAAEGDYNQGEMALTVSEGMEPVLGVTTNRVIVSSGVTLVSEKGPAKTIIRGRKTTDPAGEKYGRGPGAIRCVFMERNSCLEGFTVADGSVGLADGPFNDDSTAGGILVRDRTGGMYGIVRDCIITNCSGDRAGGACGGSYYNCRFVDNQAAMGGAGRAVALYGCTIMTNSLKSSDPGVEVPTRIENCTFGPGLNVWEYAGNSKPILNSVFMGTYTPQKSYTVVFSNCAFAVGAIPDDRISYVSSNACIALRMDEFKVDGLLRPLKESPLVDRGANADVPQGLNGRDAFGGQRIYNGCVDLGAAEFDWRDVYAEMLGPNVLVIRSTPSVVSTSDGVALSDGSALETSYAGTVGKKCTVIVQVDGAGVLNVYRNGEPVALVTAADGKRTLRFRNEDEAVNLDFSFVGDGRATIASIGRPTGMTLIVR